LVSAAEVAIAAAIVIGHNVFRRIPNEVPILFVLGLMSARMRDGSVASLGLVKPKSWMRVVLVALAAAIARILLGTIAIDPLTALVWPPARTPEGVNEITGNVLVAAQWLGIVWTFAAFGEEIGYRGYIVTRTADIGGQTRASAGIGVALSAILFGFGHYYKGPAGVVDDVFAGLILGAAYMAAGRNLWASILAHGFIDTIGVVLAFFGLSD
jgi:uncharacterized protein